MTVLKSSFRWGMESEDILSQGITRGDSGREAAFFTPHLQLFIFHCHHISEFSHQGLKLINVHSGHVIGAYVRLQDLLLDPGLGAIPSNVSGLLAIIAIAFGEDSVYLHGIGVRCGSRIQAWGQTMFHGLQSCKHWVSRLYGILALEHSSDVNGALFQEEYLVRRLVLE